MGVKNFTLLLKTHFPPQPFDSILIDVQSMLYVAIGYATKTQEDLFIEEVSQIFIRQLAKLLSDVFKTTCDDNVTVVVSFDGHGVPMKWPTQRERRQRDIEGKSLYRSSLFGNNTLSAKFLQTFRKALLSGEFPRFETPKTVRYVLSGCDMPGEGEHKIFDIAEKMGCRRPLVASVDNDVFFLSLFRRDRYDTIQVYRKGHFYDVSRSWENAVHRNRLIAIGFLFGNDFVKELFYITQTNTESVNAALESSDYDDETWPVVVATFLKTVDCDVRFSKGSVDRRHLVDFWTTCLWIRDYYTKREFPQRNMVNLVRELFDRNVLLTGLTELDFSSDAFREACKSYAVLQTERSVKNSHLQVFEGGVLEKIERFIIPRDEYDGTIETITLSMRPSPPPERPIEI